VRKSLRDGLLGDASNVRASRSKQGPFEALCDIPEFRQLVVAAAPLSVAAPRPRPASPAAEPAPADAAPEPPTKPDLDAGGGAAPFHLAEWLKWLIFFVVLLAGAAAAFWFFS
jgi:hypothetical protein